MTRMQPSKLFLIVTVGLCSLMSLAHANAERAAIVVSGNASPHERELVSSTMQTTASGIGRSLVAPAPAFSARELATVTRCLSDKQPWTCMTQIVSRRGLSLLAIVSLDTGQGPDGTPQLVLSAQIVDAKLISPVSDQKYCPRCTDDVLAKLTSELTIDLLREVAAQSGKTVVSIKSVPSGARITFDGKPLGATDLSFNTYPGSHTVVLEREGHYPETRTVDAIEHQTTEITVPLRPIAAKPPEQNPGQGTDRRPVPRRSRLVPGIVLGMGLAAVASGGVLILVHDEPTRPLPTEDQEPYYYDTRLPGIVIAAGGAVAVGVGVYLWRRASRSRAVPTIVPRSGGAMIGWSTSF